MGLFKNAILGAGIGAGIGYYNSDPGRGWRGAASGAMIGSAGGAVLGSGISKLGNKGISKIRSLRPNKLSSSSPIPINSIKKPGRSNLVSNRPLTSLRNNVNNARMNASIGMKMAKQGALNQIAGLGAMGNFAGARAFYAAGEFARGAGELARGAGTRASYAAGESARGVGRRVGAALGSLK
jgi:hypothetical protein